MGMFMDMMPKIFINIASLYLPGGEFERDFPTILTTHPENFRKIQFLPMHINSLCVDSGHVLLFKTPLNFFIIFCRQRKNDVFPPLIFQLYQSVIQLSKQFSV